MIMCVTSITDFISKIQNPSLWTRLHLVHYWDALLEAGSDVSEAFLLSVAKIEAENSQKVKKRATLSGRPATVPLARAFIFTRRRYSLFWSHFEWPWPGEHRFRLPQISCSSTEMVLQRVYSFTERRKP